MPLICTPCVDLTEDLQHIHTQAAGAFQFTSLYRLFYELPTSFGVADSPDQLQGRHDRVRCRCKKKPQTPVQKDLDHIWLHKLIQINSK